jgi:hypothetical protein
MLMMMMWVGALQATETPARDRFSFREIREWAQA